MQTSSEKNIIAAVDAVPERAVDLAEERLAQTAETIKKPAASIPPTTTAEENLHTASQRAVNKIWEFTQAAIAILMTITVCIIMLLMVWRGEYTVTLQFLSAAFFLIIGFYFGRTNHEKVGGVQMPYKGR